MNPTLANAALNLKRRAQRRIRSHAPALWLMSDEQRLPDPAKALRSLPRGAAVILRHYGAPERTALAATLAGLCHRYGLRLMIAGDWRLAAHVKADGLHLAEYAAKRGPAPGARLWLRQKSRQLSVAAHGPRGLCVAKNQRATAVLLSPVFATASHPGRRPLTPARLAAMTRATTIPVIGLGGVDARTIIRLRDSGCAGVAGIGFALA